MAMWTCSSTSGQASTARMAEPTVDTEFRVLRKWWVEATTKPMTIQMMPPNETCRAPTGPQGSRVRSPRPKATPGQSHPARSAQSALLGVDQQVENLADGALRADRIA